YIIDLGPEGGEMGGYVIGSGTPEKITRLKNSYTGKFLRPYLSPHQSSPLRGEYT
ncbi:MAG: hypothetical protein HY354_01155, partial [Planctomycetes bacterium]|nr:hypothetical protein [Planctomycetota bacterium]